MAAFEGTMRRLLAAAFEGLSTAGDLQALIASMAAPLIWPLLTTGAWLVAGSLALHLVSTQFGLAPSKLAPDFTRLNGFSRLAQDPCIRALL